MFVLSNPTTAAEAVIERHEPVLLSMANLSFSASTVFDE
jgi:hypothetical protein